MVGGRNPVRLLQTFPVTAVVRVGDLMVSFGSVVAVGATLGVTTGVVAADGRPALADGEAAATGGLLGELEAVGPPQAATANASVSPRAALIVAIDVIASNPRSRRCPTARTPSRAATRTARS